MGEGLRWLLPPLLTAKSETSHMVKSMASGSAKWVSGHSLLMLRGLRSGFRTTSSFAVMEFGCLCHLAPRGGVSRCRLEAAGSGSLA